MRARLFILMGMWALQFDGSRPQFTSFKATVPSNRVLKAVRRDFPESEIIPPNETLSLFDAEELREYELSACPLFAEEYGHV